jgi:predicted transcriptional regulator
MTDRTKSDKPNTREDALSLYSGPRRRYEIFCLVAEGPKSIQQIWGAVPGDEEFIRSIVQGMVEEDLARPSNRGERYELSTRGRRIKESLDQLPEDIKAQAYQEAWRTPPPEGY